jgi:hypothetical protein
VEHADGHVAVVVYLGFYVEKLAVVYENEDVGDDFFFVVSNRHGGWEADCAGGWKLCVKQAIDEVNDGFVGCGLHYLLENGVEHFADVFHGSSIQNCEIFASSSSPSK